MAVEAARDAALLPFAPGPLLRIGAGALRVDIAPQAGGRLAQVTHDGIDWLAGYDERHRAMIAWGSFPMLPWAGRVRAGRFAFEGRTHRLPPTLGAHAIHGVGYALPWQVDAHAATRAELSLLLPEDASWPFGGIARQRIALEPDAMQLELSLTAGMHAMPATIGWHPWLRRPQQLEFAPSACYPRDAEGIATLPLVAPPAPPWDDCFINTDAVVLQLDRHRLRLRSDCIHWVVYSEREHLLCVEPQTGPPDAFTLAPHVLAPGATLTAWFRWEWS
jgi:aldose 1-epimerase